MLTFKEFFDEKENRKPQTPPLGNLGSGISEHLMIIARMAAENHLEELTNFFEKLAHKDSQIKVEFENYKRDPMAKKARLPFSDREVDKISPIRSDGSSPEDFE